MHAPLLSRDDLMALVQSVWTSMLGLPVVAESCERVVCDASRLAGSVSIAGAWNGLVLLVPTETFVRRAATLLLDVPPEQVTRSDMEDVLAELCNILGGGIKSLLPGPSVLALPKVLRGASHAVRLSRLKLLAGVRFRCEQQPLSLGVFQQEVSQPTACGFPGEEQPRVAWW